MTFAGRRVTHLMRKPHTLIFCSLMLLKACGKPQTAVLPNNAMVVSDDAISSSGLSVTLEPLSKPEALKSFFTVAKILAFVDAGFLSGSGDGAAFAAAVVSGEFSIPQPFKQPLFATGRSFLSLNKEGTDFWLIEAVDAGTKISRPAQTLSLPLPDALGSALSVTLTGQSAVLGFGVDFLILKSTKSLWIVRRSAGVLKASEVNFPNPSAVPLSAGQVLGTDESFWIADAKSVWRISQNEQDWKAEKSSLKLKNAAGDLERLLAVFAASGKGLKPAGPVVALSGGNIFVSGLTLAGAAAVKKETVQNNTAGAMSFAEASALCNACHATTSALNGAKQKLSGTENISVWVQNKSAIKNSVESNFMPSGRTLTDEQKQKLLRFIENPSP